MTAVAHPRAEPRYASLIRGGRAYVWMTLLALVLAAISLLWPSTPSYDPWSWLEWGREIFHGRLIIAGGSSWKPLPVIFTTVFAAFGSAQPYLWLLVARAGAALSIMVTTKLAARVSWRIVAAYRAGEPPLHALSFKERLAAISPALLAAAIALVGTAWTPTYPVPMMLGYSEGLAFTGFLIAGERAWDGRHRQAFAVGIVPCLDRPEVWPIWLIYGLWIIWRDRRALPLVAGLFVLMLALWAVPQKLGGGTLVGLATHAQHNHSAHSAVNSSFPFWHELSEVVWPLAIERVEAVALILIALTLYLVVRDRRRAGGWLGSIRRHSAVATAAFSGALGFIWWLGISLETQLGFAGNPRYAILGVFLVYIGGSAGYAWAAVGLARLVRKPRRRGVGAAASGTLAAALAMTLVFLFVPGWFAHRLPSLNSIRYALRYQAELRERFVALIRRDGGAARVLACGTVMTNNYQVTMLAWYLDVPIPRVQALPHALETGIQGPNVVFQDAASQGAPIGPTEAQIQAWDEGWQSRDHTRYRVVADAPVTFYADCSAPGTI